MLICLGILGLSIIVHIIRRYGGKSLHYNKKLFNTLVITYQHVLLYKFANIAGGTAQ